MEGVRITKSETEKLGTKLSSSLEDNLGVLEHIKQHINENTKSILVVVLNEVKTQDDGNRQMKSYISSGLRPCDLTMIKVSVDTYLDERAVEAAIKSLIGSGKA